MKQAISHSYYVLVIIGMLFLFVQPNAAALTIVLAKPVPLEKELINYLNQASNNDKNQWQLIMFGFAHCKDVCPLSLVNFSRLMQVAAKERIKLGGTFVTIDPDRDTEAFLSNYTKKFDLNLSYLRLEGEALERFKTAFGAEAIFYTKNAGNKINYQVDHSSTAFLVDPAGRIRVLFDPLQDMSDITEMLHQKRTFFRL